jgi:Alcohol dehydrogenase, class IV
VPTTAGTGSEVSPAAVVSVGNKKVTLVDYSLVPDIAVVDPTLTLSMPQEITADTGIDALTHALEAAVRSSPRRTPTRSACKPST